METVFGKAIDPEHVLEEYPRPQLKRDSYLNLNGWWEYAITRSEEAPASYDGRILVPFSPEAPLSGVNRVLQPDEYLWYRRTVKIPDGFLKDVVILHFGAVDQEASLFINGTEAEHHIGGYLPFECDITNLISGNTEFEIELCVRDRSDTTYLARGKQKLKHGGIWYTPQSGIWQTVWMESVPKTYIKSISMTPHCDESMLELRVSVSRPCACVARVDGKAFTFSSGVAMKIPMPDFRFWCPDDPYLYEMSLEAGEDRVETYFAMRKVSVEKDGAGIPRIFLNNKPYFMTGLLDQGYWPDGLYTAPSDEAMIYDIGTMKQLGFNMLRKHIKIEPLRWYYHCDRLGMLVWQDMVSGGGQYDPIMISLPLITGKHKKDDQYARFARKEEASRREFIHESGETVRLLYNVPSIVTWVVFNEGWGQFDAEKCTQRLREIDSNRLFDEASGWHDQGGGDIKSLHVYFKPYRHKQFPGSRAVAVSEFGGYKLAIKDHTWSSHSFGYRSIRSREDLDFAIQDLYVRQIIPAKEQGLCATVYTQVSDVEEELNGLFTYDRDVLKVDAATIRELNAALRDDISTVE